MQESPQERREFLLKTAVAVGGAMAGASVAAQPAAAAGARQGKTFVLVHGAWHGGWCWQRVAQRLRGEGHTVYTPTQTGLGERSHLLSRQITIETFVQDIVNVLEWEDLNDVILVGHSFAGVTISGVTISGVADRVPARIRHLVYLDSLIVSGGLSIPVPAAKAFGVEQADDVSWVEAKCTPHPLSTWESPLRLQNAAVGNGRPATYVAVLPHYPTLGAVRAFAKQQPGWQYAEIEAGHDAMVTSPEALSKMLLAF